MSDQSKYYELVGAYLDNELEGDELNNFKQELNSDPLLKKEVQFQQQLIEGIRANRRLELKTRLDNISVGGATTMGTGTKIALGTVIVAGIGLGVYNFLIKEDDKLPSSTITTQEVLEQEQIPQEITVIEKEADLESDNTKIVEESKSESNIQSESRAVEVEEKTEAITPDVPQPLDDFTTDTVEEKELDIPSKSLGGAEGRVDPSLEVLIVHNKRRYDFHYQVSTGQLILYGSFDEEPYQLLEININTDKQLYLYFKDHYYNLDKNAEEITPLTQITNKELIFELSKIKNNDP